jgi:hypothetical protein
LQWTTGASKQREHEERDEDETKLARRRRGKQRSALWRLGRH